MPKKVFVFFPDGIGFRNFALTNFYKLGVSKGFDIHYWNNTNFEINKEFGYDEIKIENNKTHFLTPILSRARKHIELNIWQKKFNDPVYQTYKFPFFNKGFLNLLRTGLTKFIIGIASNKTGLKFTRSTIKFLERRESKYSYCKKQLQQHQPDLVFCTSQRATQAIAVIEAAKDLGIPTVTFIYSWDNVPKAMNVIETDYYFVWSNHMKNELLYYYPYINKEQVFVTGTPQFEPHYEKASIVSKASFFHKFNLDIKKRYICFSGDDETTSPLDQLYLEDLAIVVRELNDLDYNLGIIYRKCPVDFTGRYDYVLEKYKDVINVINPIWEQKGKQWNEIQPTKSDFALLANTCYHSEFVTNVCSSTVFDFVIHNKPCLYYNYEQPQLKKGIRDIGQNYNYVHFRSMPSKEAAVFCELKSDLKQKVKDILDYKLSNVSEGKLWYNIIAGESPQEASSNIWNAIADILN